MIDQGLSNIGSFLGDICFIFDLMYSYVSVHFIILFSICNLNYLAKIESFLIHINFTI